MKKTWKLLYEIGIRKVVTSCEAVGGGLFGIRWKVVTPDVEGVAANTQWTKVARDVWGVFCVFPGSWVQLGAVSCHLSVGFFAKEIVHKPKQNSRYAQVFPNISIALEQIHIFKVKCSSRSDCIGTFKCPCFHSYGFDFQDRDWWVEGCVPCWSLDIARLHPNQF